ITYIHREAIVRKQQTEDTFYLVCDIAKRTCLRAITKNSNIFPPQGLADKGRQRSSIIRTHTRPIRIKNAYNTGVQTMKVVIRHGHRLQKTLSFIIYASRPYRGYIAPISLGLSRYQWIPIHLRRGSYEDSGSFRLG